MRIGLAGVVARNPANRSASGLFGLRDGVARTGRYRFVNSLDGKILSKPMFVIRTLAWRDSPTEKVACRASLLRSVPG